MSNAPRPEVIVLGPRAVRRERWFVATVLAASATGTAAALSLLTAGWYHWSDLTLFALMFLVTAIGIEVGFHRLFAHRSFKTNGTVRVLLGIFGCMAAQGPIAYWVSHHRLHHLHSDDEGDPHSPVRPGAGRWQQIAGLLHAHITWMFTIKRASVGVFARDVLSDRQLRFVDRGYWTWLSLGILLPGVVNWIWVGTPIAAVTGVLFGGLARLFIVNQAIYSINSICHTFGSQPFRTGDESRNYAPLAIPTLGQSWHNNHHAFPNSARMGLTWWQIDIGYWVIAALRRVGCVWDVFVPDDTGAGQKIRRSGESTTPPR
jgi:stearoyl-CoA desaturase (delta-9 desaturase)